MDRPTRIPKSRRHAMSRLAKETRGATAIEYGMIAAVIVIVMIVSFREVAAVTIGMWNNVNTKVTTAQ
jgi:pilus assembly protein Flp/PilA